MIPCRSSLSTFLISSWVSDIIPIFISKVVESYKRDKKPWFRPFGAIQYDQRNSRISIDKVSIMTLQGRLKLATRLL
ncbi:MAG: hypothetical protein WAM14_10475 [Candidatus Nitrosopolaris sp.]